MITYNAGNFNKKYKREYNSFIHQLNVYSLECPVCHKKGQMIKWGFYDRSLKNNSKKSTFTIQRVKCKGCNTTHAILPSYIIPYSQFTLQVTLDCILNTLEELETLMIQNLFITEQTVSRIRNKYKKHWKQRMLSRDIRFDDTLVYLCFFHYKRQFMQIKTIPNILYQPTT